jgi:hypothetical protein
VKAGLAKPRHVAPRADPVRVFICTAELELRRAFRAARGGPLIDRCEELDRVILGFSQRAQPFHARDHIRIVTTLVVIVHAEAWYASTGKAPRPRTLFPASPRLYQSRGPASVSRLHASSSAPANLQWSAVHLSFPYRAPSLVENWPRAHSRDGAECRPVIVRLAGTYLIRS